MPELNPRDIEIGFSAASMERRALALIISREEHNGKVRVCERIIRDLPRGCWEEGGWSPYALYGDDRWCDSCIAYAALNGALPKPEITIEASGRSIAHA